MRSLSKDESQKALPPTLCNLTRAWNKAGDLLSKRKKESVTLPFVLAKNGYDGREGRLVKWYNFGLQNRCRGFDSLIARKLPICGFQGLHKEKEYQKRDNHDGCADVVGKICAEAVEETSHERCERACDGLQALVGALDAPLHMWLGRVGDETAHCGLE